MKRLADRPSRREAAERERAQGFHELMSLRENSGTGRHPAPAGPVEVADTEHGGACDACRITWAWPRHGQGTHGWDLSQFVCPECSGRPLRAAQGQQGYATRRMPRALMTNLATSKCGCGAPVLRGLLCTDCARRRAAFADMPTASRPLPDYTGPRCADEGCENPSSDERERCARCQARIDAIPTIFGVGRGWPERNAAHQAWIAEHGDRTRRSYGWQVYYGGAVAADVAPGACLPVVMNVRLTCQHHGRPECMCVGDDVFRGGCQVCAWEGELRGHENTAIEDAHDHAFPGWRDLPTVQLPAYDAKPKQLAAWHEKNDRLYPPGWFARGGPVRTHRESRMMSRHHTSQHLPGFDIGDILDTAPGGELLA